MNIRRLLLLIFSLAFLSMEAQRSGHFINNYLPSDYRGFNQVWQAAQDKNGVMYFAGTSSVYVYDGQQWETIPVRPGAANRQIVLDSATNTMYIGAVSEFGYLERRADGKLRYRSLSDSLSGNAKIFSDVWKVYVLDGCVYFQASERIFVVKDKKIIRIIEAPENKTFAFAFPVGNQLFIRQRNVGFVELKNDSVLSLTPGGEIFGTERILGVIPWKPHQQLVLTGEKGFYTMSDQPANGSLYQPVMSDSFLLNASVLGCIWVNDSMIAVNTRTGIGFYSRELQLKEIINKTSGMSDVSISALFLDREKNLWAMHNNGISCISYNSPVLFFDDKSGFYGTLNLSIDFHGSQYLGTTEGLFLQEKAKPGEGSSVRFTRVGGLQTEVWDLAVIDDQLYLATSMGLARLENDNVVFTNEFYTDVIRNVPGTPLVVTGEKGGLTVLRTQDHALPQIIRHYDMPGEEILRMSHVMDCKTQPGKKEIWTVNRFKNIQHIIFGIGDSSISVTNYDTLRGMKRDEYFPVNIGDAVYFFSTTRCYTYDPSKDKGGNSVCFFEAPEIFERICNGDLSGMTAPFDARLFLDKNNTSQYFFFGEDHGKIRSHLFEFGGLFGYNGVQFGTVQSDNSLWVMSNDLLLHSSSGILRDTSLKLQALIRSVQIGKDSMVLYGTDEATLTLEKEIPYRYNSISFRFASPCFMFNEKVVFSYRLDGFDTSWSKYSTAFEKEYTNLPEGTYTFRVRAANSFGMDSQEATCTFTILPPWYRTGWAYTFYALGFIGIIFLSVRLGARRLRLQKEKLEVLVNERTAEVVEQKQQLESAFKDIRDSITYAQRIQEAILPVDAEIARIIPESFIFFRPRDIVSGDFYWLASTETKSFIACVDCTGHGVPGAFMSMIGNTLLNQIVIEKKTEAPELILEALHSGVRHALRQDTGGETRDGMDIALCVIDHATMQLSYAGANRPLWRISLNDFHEIKADKYSIAGDQLEEQRKFKGHTLQLQKGDCIYLSTDGYADQFGGEKGKKFMVKRFQQLLLAIHQQPMQEQRRRLEHAFLEWKGPLGQVDDVLVIGFRIG